MMNQTEIKLKKKLFLSFFIVFTVLTLAGFSCSADIGRDIGTICDTSIVNGNWIKTDPKYYGVATAEYNANPRRYNGTCGVKRNADRQMFGAVITPKSSNSDENNPAKGLDVSWKNVVFGFDQRSRPEGNTCRRETWWSSNSYTKINIWCKFTNPPGTTFPGQVRFEAGRGRDLLRTIVFLRTRTTVFE